jgi:hypothetical protein
VEKRREGVLPEGGNKTIGKIKKRESMKEKRRNKNTIWS